LSKTKHDAICTGMPESSDVEMFILAAVCKETEKNRKKKRNKM
jgi:hypothetical protein